MSLPLSLCFRLASHPQISEKTRYTHMIPGSVVISFNQIIHMDYHINTSLFFQAGLPTPAVVAEVQVSILTTCLGKFNISSV
jgi:hypothetical protein